MARLRGIPGQYTTDTDPTVMPDAATLAAAGALRIAGTFTNTLADATLAATGTLTLSATLSRTLARFAGLPHRVQDVCVRAGVRYVDDSKATNPAAAIASLDIVVKEDLPANAAKQGAYLLEALRPFAERFASVGEVRGKGGVGARGVVRPGRAFRPTLCQRVDVAFP